LGSGSAALGDRRRLGAGEKVVAEGPKVRKGWWSVRSLSNLRSKANRSGEEAESERQPVQAEEEVTAMAKFFINRRSLLFHCHRHGHRGIVAILGCHRQYPNIVPRKSTSTPLCRRRRAGGRTVGCDPIEQEMSGVDNMNYMYSLNANNGELSCM